ncbi:MAG: S-layer homology domain-containing protein [Clostridia bacterium]|nr:S-layer homology domain-containing protein [Clostridia bacterium]
MKKQIICLVTLLSLVICSVLAVSAEAGFGSGVAVMAEGTEIVKGAISGSKVIFSDLDIKQGLCITDFEKIEITQAPPSSDGTLMLAGRRVGAGTVIKRKNVGALVFIPSSAELAETAFSFKTDDFGEGCEVRMLIKFTEKVNAAPSTGEELAEAGAVVTQREIRAWGRMTATDSDSDAIKYMIIKYPTVGALNVIDENTGEFVYTPPVGYVGEDSFTYVARDEWGNFSRPAEVRIAVKERACETVYADMTDNPAYNAAVTLTSMGAVDGRLIGGGVYFMPEGTLTRAEFVTMALKCAGVEVNAEDTDVYFDDADEIAAPMLPYIGAAARLGIITGHFNGDELLFSPNESITRYEAAMILTALTQDAELGEVEVFCNLDSCPVWAESAVVKMYALGIFEDGVEVSADEAISRAECVTYLYNMMNLS